MSYALEAGITGSTTATAGSSSSYSVSDIDYGTSWAWVVTGGTITSSSKNAGLSQDGSSNVYVYKVTVTWNTVGTGSVSFKVNTQAVYSYSVTVCPSTVSIPSVTFSMVNNCGSTVLSYSGTPPTGVTWSWQTSSTGTASNQTGTSYTVTSSGIYYLRAFTACGGVSTALATPSVTINAVPSSPSGASASAACGPTGSTTVSATPGANGNSINFYTTSTGGSIIASGSSWTTTANVAATFYLATVNTSTGCESGRVGVSPSVYSLPATPSAPVAQGSCGNSILTCATTPPTGITWYWQGTDAAGTSTSNNSSLSYTATASGTYYVRASNNTTGCWSTGSSSVAVTVNPLPIKPPVPTVQNNCGSTVMTRATPLTGITWYWQGTDASGTDTSNPSSAYTATSSGTYYLRASDNTTGCWSPATSASVTINALPAAPSAPTVQNNCGSSVMTRATPLAGITWYWQGTDASGTDTSNPSSAYTATSSGTYYLRASDNTTGCWSSGIPIVLSIQGVPTALAGNQDIFSNQQTSVVISNPNNVPNTTYSWSVSAPGISGANVGNGALIAQTLKTTVQPYATAVYSITPIANGCSGTPIDLTVKVYSQPVINAPQNYVLQGIAVPLDAGAEYDSYSWKNSVGVVVGNARIYTSNIPDKYMVTVTKSGASASVSFVLYSQLGGIDMNYLTTNTVLVDGVTDPALPDNMPVDQVNQITTYFDGIGRRVQNVATQGSPAKNDIVTPVVYDIFGREYRKYLPVSKENNGRYKNGILDSSGNYTGVALGFYNNGGGDKIVDDPKPFSEMVFENSPLNRVLKQGSAGASWQPNGDPSDPSDRTVKKGYGANGSGEVLLFSYESPTRRVTVSTDSAGRFYPPGRLFANKILDEHNNEVIEYSDKEGHTVCRKVQSGGTTVSPKFAETYYIYDDFGNLSVVLQPEGVARLKIELDID